MHCTCCLPVDTLCVNLQATVVTQGMRRAISETSDAVNTQLQPFCSAFGKFCERSICCTDAYPFSNPMPTLSVPPCLPFHYSHFLFSPPPNLTLRYPYPALPQSPTHASPECLPMWQPQSLVPACPKASASPPQRWTPIVGK